MRLGCFLLVLLCCTPSYRCNEQEGGLHCRTAENSSLVFVPCPPMTAGDIKYKLFMNDEEMHVLDTGTKGQSNKTHRDVRPVTDEAGALLGFRLTKKAISKHVSYICKGTLYYPPPLITKKSHPVLVLEEGQGCPRQTKSDEGNDPQAARTDGPAWIWITLVALLSTYSLAVTIVAVVTWHKLKDADSQNDYMNTKPKAPPNRRKKRGLQHPVPKHF